MGFNKYRSVKELWLDKTGVLTNEQVYAAMAERGTELEAKAREEYIRYTQTPMEDVTLIHPEFDFMRASLDGFNFTIKRILEIKCPNFRNHYRCVTENFIKPEYYCQIQHQYMVSGAESADYWSFDGEKGHRIPVLPDPLLIEVLMEREVLFWQFVRKNKEPIADLFKPDPRFEFAS